MTLLTAVRSEYKTLVAPKQISHRPDLAGRQHIYSSVDYGQPQANPVGDTYLDYATLYTVHPWVHKAIQKISDQIAPLNIRVVNAEDKEQTGHPVAELFSYINDTVSPSLFWNQYSIHMMLGGETLFDLGTEAKPTELWQWQPDRFLVHPDQSQPRYPRVAGYTVTGEDGDDQFLDYTQAIHVKFYNPLNSWRGIGPITAIREGVTIDLFAQMWSKRFLKNSARPDFAIVAPQGLTATERDRYLADFMHQHQGADRAHLPVILEDGMTDIKPFSWAPKDIEWLQQREFSRDEVGAIFGVPDEIMGYGRDTYENFETALKVFWVLTCKPFIDHRDSVLTRFFSKVRPMLRPGERIDTDTSEVSALQDDILPKVQAAYTLWTMGVPFNTLDDRLGLGIGAIRDDGRRPPMDEPSEDEDEDEEEGGTVQRFFTRWTGKITPDAYKALILQLDPSDDEAEQVVRMALEQRSERSIRRALNSLLDTLFPEGWGDFVDPQIEADRIHRRFLADQQLRDAVSRALQDGVDLGVSVAVDQLGRVGIGLDYTLPHVAAREWALRYTDELLTQMGTTTRTGVGQAIARWVDNGEPLQSLISDLQPFFGPRRAELIASTEVTRAYGEGALVTYREAGFGESEPTQKVPVHPRCRCWITVRINDDGSADYIFNTSRDERVCPLCGPLHGRSVGRARSAG